MLKYLFCLDSDEDINKIQSGEIDRLVNQDETLETIKLTVNKDQEKDQILEVLDGMDEDEYIVFVPCGNILVQPIDYYKVEKLSGQCRQEELDYCRLKYAGVSKWKPNTTLHIDSSDIFFICPHIFKVSTLKQVISNVSHPEGLFWQSIDTVGVKGSFYFNPDDQNSYPNFTYYVPAIMHTLTAIVDEDGKWSASHTDYNKKYLRSLTAEYNLDIEERGIQSSANLQECCK